MAVNYENENELDAADTQVDLETAEDGEGKTHPFSEVARAEAALERSRERVERSMSALRAAVARTTDWRAWFARQPGVFLGAAVVVGFMLGYRRAGGRGSNRR